MFITWCWLLGLGGEGLAGLSQEHRRVKGKLFFLPNTHKAKYVVWIMMTRASQVKNLPANAGDIRDSGSISGSGRSPEGGHGDPLQYFCLENPMDTGAWWLQSMGS